MLLPSCFVFGCILCPTFLVELVMRLYRKNKYGLFFKRRVSILFFGVFVSLALFLGLKSYKKENSDRYIDFDQDKYYSVIDKTRLESFAVSWVDYFNIKNNDKAISENAAESVFPDQALNPDQPRNVTIPKPSVGDFGMDYLAILLAFVSSFFMFMYFRKGLHFLKTTPVSRSYNIDFLSKNTTFKNTDYYFLLEIKNYHKISSENYYIDSDDLIRCSTRKIIEFIQAEDAVFHINNGQFVLYIKNGMYKPIDVFIKNLISELSFDIDYDDKKIRIQFVAGLDLPKPLQSDIFQWQQRHQRALYALNRALANGLDYQICTDEMFAECDLNDKILNELINIFKNKKSNLDMYLVYQPIVDTHDVEKIAGAEVLLRCKFNNQYISPNKIVKICEDNGLGKKLGLWLFEGVSRECKDIIYLVDFLSINLNPAMLCEELPVYIERLVNQFGLPARKFCLEITEDNAAINFEKMLPLIIQLKKLGFTFALDDFGTGYSSLEYLQRLSLDKLKVDRCFVENIDSDTNKKDFLEKIIAMASSLGIETIIEGIENIDQADVALQLGADFLQGFYYYEPIRLSCFEKILREYYRLRNIA